VLTDFNEIYNFCEETGNTATYRTSGRAGLLQGDGGVGKYKLVPINWTEKGMGAEDFLLRKDQLIVDGRAQCLDCLKKNIRIERGKKIMN
jgi:hypothetical protein